MRIYRYLFKEVSNSFAAVAIVLLLIFVSGRFVKYLSEVAAGAISSKVLFSIMLFRIPGFMELILPLALFLGTMLAYGRLYVESEMVVLQACGISKTRLLAYTQGVAVLVMLLTALFTLYITPLGWKHFQKIWNDPKTYSGLGTMVSGSFQKFDTQGVVVYSAEMNQEKNALRDVFIVRGNDESNHNTLFVMKAKSATVISTPDADPYIELYDGMQYSGEPGKLEFSATRYRIYGQRIGDSRKQGATRNEEVDGIPTLDLLHSDKKADQAAFYWRSSLPFIVPILALLALALSETTHRKGRYGKLLPGIVIYIFYIALLIGVRSTVEKGSSLPPAAAFALVHGFFLGLGLLLLYFNEIKMAISRFQANRNSLARLA